MSNKPPLIAVPKGATALDVLAERYRAAFEKMEGGREQWIEGTLELAVVVAEARTQIPDHREYSRWIQRHGLLSMHNNDRSALIGFAKNLDTARKLLEKSSSISWRVIWENRLQRTPTKIGKGPQTPISRSSGSSKRNRAQRIPDVMRDDPPPPPPPKLRKPLSAYFLKPEQVDPDFKGTALDFATKYGHVPLHTKGELEHHRQQEVLAAWLGRVNDFERAGRMMLGALSAVDAATIGEWKGKSGKTDKLRTWCDSVEIAYDALRKL